MNRFDELMFLIEKTSKKEKHRMDNFLKRHNYDPKTRTIETDEVGKDGKKIRVKLNITNGPVFSDATDSYFDDDGYVGSEINMAAKTLKRKPMISDGMLKHEEGHIAYNRNPDKYKELYDKAKKAIEDDENDKVEHGKNPKEYIADMYSATHSKYGIDGFNKMINSFRKDEKYIKDELKDINNYYMKNKDITSDDIEEMEKRCKDIRLKLKTSKKRIDENNKKLSKLKLDLSMAKKQNVNPKQINELERNVRTATSILSQFGIKKIDKYEEELKRLEKKISNTRNSARSAKTTKDRLDELKDDFRQDAENYANKFNNEMNLRQKFARDNIKESTDVLLDIYEAEYSGDITSEERDILLSYLNEKRR